MTRRIGLYTAKQMLRGFEAWGCSEPLPGKKNVVLIAFPDGTALRISKTDMKGSGRGAGLLYALDYWHPSYGGVPFGEESSMSTPYGGASCLSTR